jgi:putative transposase
MSRWQPQKQAFSSCRLAFLVVARLYLAFLVVSAAFFGDEEGLAMSSTASGESRKEFDRPLAAFLDHPDLPLADVLTNQDVRQACTKHSVVFGLARNVLFTPCLTLWTMLSSVVGSDKSCAAACVRVSVLLLALSRPRWSEDAGVFCRARARMPMVFLQELAQTLADRLEQAAPPHWLWRGLHAYLGDGTVVVLPDSPENQAGFPQHRNQKKGLGTPMIRLVVLMSLAVGAISAMAWGPCQGKGTGETALFRQLIGRLKRGDLVVLDRNFGHYWTIALLHIADVHVCVRMHANKKYDFTKGKRLGHLDHIVSWKRPPRPKWMTEEQYQRFPAELTLREIGIDLAQRGGVGGRVVVATTLLDGAAYAKDDIAELYKWRWQVEVDLRHLKATMKMRELSSKTPTGVARELWTHALGHNLVRKVMAQAALYQRPSKRPSRQRRGAASAGPLTPRQISFKAALRQVQDNAETLSTAALEQGKQIAENILTTLASQRVGKRPGRQEPRAIKRRPVSQAMLSKPRAEVKKAMAEGKTGAAAGIKERRK